MTLPLPDPPRFGEPLPQAPCLEVLAFLSRRRSASAVTLQAPAPDDAELMTLLRLATRVPDHGKLSPWRFIVLREPVKAQAVARLEALAQGRGEPKAAGKLAKLKLPPLAVIVVSRARPGLDIPEWEQQLSAGAVSTLLMVSAQAMGYGANWITDWYSYDPQARAILGLDPEEQVAGVVLMGTPKEPPLERERPDPAALATDWRP